MSGVALNPFRGRVSSVRASLANGRRASRASYAAGSRRVSQLARSRTSVAAAAGHTSGEASSSGDVGTSPVKEGEEVEDELRQAEGPASRRESAMLLVRQQAGLC